jgi:hypothetical protein
MGYQRGRFGSGTADASTGVHDGHREPNRLPLPVSGLLRGALTGVMTAITIAGGLAIYAIAEGGGMDDGADALYLIGTVGALTGAVVGAALGLVVGTLLIPVRAHVRRLGPWAGLTAWIIVAPTTWLWWFERNAMPFDPGRDAGAIVGLPIAVAALTTLAAWTVPVGRPGEALDACAASQQQRAS